MKVTFGDIREYMTEIRREFPASKKASPATIIRSSALWKDSRMIPGGSSVTIVSTYRDTRGDIVRYEELIGGFISNDDPNKQKVLARLIEYQAKLKAICEELSLELRGGIID